MITLCLRRGAWCRAGRLRGCPREQQGLQPHGSELWQPVFQDEGEPRTANGSKEPREAAGAARGTSPRIRRPERRKSRRLVTPMQVPFPGGAGGPEGRSSSSSPGYLVTRSEQRPQRDSELLFRAQERRARPQSRLSRGRSKCLERGVPWCLAPYLTFQHHVAVVSNFPSQFIHKMRTCLKWDVVLKVTSAAR